MAIHHVVLLKFKPGITPIEAETVRASLHALPSQIPAISDFKAGPKVKHPLDQDYDEGVILIFKDQEALKAYLPHPAHLKHVEHVTPYIQDTIVFNVDVKE